MKFFVIAVCLVATGAYFLKIWQNKSSQVDNNESVELSISPALEPSGQPIPSFVPIKYDDAQIGYITDVYEKGGKRYIKIDYVQWLSHSDGTCWNQKEVEGVPECNPNGYLIVNSNPLIRTFEIDPEATFELSRSAQSVDAEFQEFKEFYTYNTSLFHIYFENGKIIKVEEQYTP